VKKITYAIKQLYDTAMVLLNVRTPLLLTFSIFADEPEGFFGQMGIEIHLASFISPP
jgi:hypothetical protein